MKPLHLCVPVLKRYDLLRDLLQSASESTVKPTTVYVINNGRDTERLMAARCIGLSIDIITPSKPMGVAESWNWFIENVPEERLIVNDDVTFAPDSIERMMEVPGDFVSGLKDNNAFSCFILRDSCIAKVGLFDETISPHYAYFEDCDYSERMKREWVEINGIECGVQHGKSQTLRMNTPIEMDEHHRKFLLAQGNYIKKWGKLPEGMQRQM